MSTPQTAPGVASPTTPPSTPAPVVTPSPPAAPPVAPTPKPSAGVGALPPMPTGDETPPPSEAPAPAASTPPAAAPKAVLAATDFKFGEGMVADDAVMADFVPMVNELGLQKTQAQKLVDLYTKAQTAQAAKAAASFESNQKKWAESLKADSEIGGPDFDKHLGFARKAMAKYGSDELKSLLDSTGLGNHPDMVKFVARVGKAMAEDSVAGTSSGPTASPANNEDSFHRALYPNSPQMWGRGNS